MFDKNFVIGFSPEEKSLGLHLHAWKALVDAGFDITGFTSELPSNEALQHTRYLKYSTRSEYIYFADHSSFFNDNEVLYLKHVSEALNLVGAKNKVAITEAQVLLLASKLQELQALTAEVNTLKENLGVI